VFPGKVMTIGRQVEPVARAVLSRISIDDKNGLLKIGLFGTVTVILPDPSTAPPVPLVPRSAVTKVEDRTVVFVETATRAFELRTVEIGHTAAGKIEVLKGLAAGERVATSGLFTLKSLVLKPTFGEEE
jgi:multidrug efflux pump subunit AcrA (membrane-fusion protein)